MRNPVHFLDTKTMDWEQLQKPGLYSKLLSRDPESGARTALNRIVPEEGMRPPGAAHFHCTTEELLIIKGRMSFDSEVWLTPQSYCFHPPETVHGFKSSVPEESWFLSRIGQELDFNFVDEPMQLSPYYVGEKKPVRPVVYHSDPSDGDWEKIDSAQRYVLSLHPENGEGSVLLRTKPGWVSGRDGETLQRFEELYVLEGTLLCSDGDTYDQGCYQFEPSGSYRRRLTCLEPALIYFTIGPAN